MFITIIVPISILIPILLGFFYFKSLSNGAKFLLYYLISSGLINLGAIVLVAMHRRNLPLLHVYTIVETVLILSYLRTIFTDQKIKQIILGLSIAFPTLCVINFSFFQSIYTYNTYTRPLGAILLTFFCLLYFYKSTFSENWIKKPEHWFNMGILIYFPVVCIIFIVSNYMAFVVKDKAMNNMVWNVHAAVVLLMYLIWAKGFSLYKNDR